MLVLAVKDGVSVLMETPDNSDRIFVFKEGNSSMEFTTPIEKAIDEAARKLARG